ncbi:WD40-repeat-containing domain protein [Lanmaoa asiatica]|nr:WD40-repeat-containing domain protein [Lanmaoa asiatica]
MGYHHRITLPIPAQVSCLSSIDSQRLLVGSDDGSVRLYCLDTFKVLKAIRGLGPISSVAFHSQPPAAHLWVASGRQALRFSLSTDKLILTSSDALQRLDIGVDDDDNSGDLSINVKGTKMAFCTDSGSVGVVDLQTNEVTRMKQSHNNVCGSVRFIPGRPSELVSGGYDYAMLHFDFMQGSVLSRDDLSAAPVSSGVSLSPPFILSLSISPTGIIAAGTADGRLYIGTGGEKSSETSAGRQRRQRKWKGLRMDDRIIADVAEGPIVALYVHYYNLRKDIHLIRRAFSEPRELLTCTLLGKVTQYHICGSATDGTLKLEPQWRSESKDSYKVNAIACSGGSTIIGGFQKDGTGVIEVWSTC